MQGTESDTGHDGDTAVQQPHPLAEERRNEALTKTPRETETVLKGRWVQKSPRRMLKAGILGLALVGVAVGLELTFTIRTFEALAVLVAFTIVAVIAHTAFTVSAPTTVTLDGPVIEVRRGNETDTFDLTRPIRRIVTIGRSNRPNWRIRFETGDGRVVELGPTQVDPHVMTEVLARYRAGSVPPQRRAG